VGIRKGEILVKIKELFVAAALLPAAAGAASSDTQSLSGRWSVSGELFGTRLFMDLSLEQQGDALTGKYDGSDLAGTRKGKHVHFVVSESDSAKDMVDADYADGKLTGTVQESDSGDPDHKTRYAFTAIRVPEVKPGQAKRYDFKPSVFYRAFSPFNEPVLAVDSGDTIHTTTVDAGGVDGDKVKRSLGGNPQTGPFYVRQAMPGDTLAVHLVRVKLNRDYAISDDDFASRAADSDIAILAKDLGKEVRWHLDRERNMASLEEPGEHTAHYEVPLRPMLGCIATSPPPVAGPMPSGDSSGSGGNMDFNQIVEGATVYLPVSVPGALLYLGDGHALQGDGEINGNALETSLEVEFTVEVISGRKTPAPRVESATRLTALYYAGSLDDAFRGATHNMSDWLTERYKLTAPEIAEVIGTAAHYEVAEVADRNAGIALSIDKERLATLAQ
jgi:amidase